MSARVAHLPRRRAVRHSDQLPRFPIADILTELGAEDVPLGSGWVKMRCPFHDDRVASAAVNHDLNGFACHGCGVSGDALKLMQTEGGLSFAEAVQRCTSITGVESGPVRRKRRRSSRLFEFTRDH